MLGGNTRIRHKDFPQKGLIDISSASSEPDNSSVWLLPIATSVEYDSATMEPRDGSGGATCEETGNQSSVTMGLFSRYSFSLFSGTHNLPALFTDNIC